MAPRHLIAVVGNGGIPETDARYVLAMELGRALVDARYRVVCGGRDGVMEAVARGGRSSPSWVDGDLIGLLPSEDGAEANRWLDVVLPTGFGLARNTLIARAEAVVAVGGGAGTLSELALAWQFKRHCLAFRCEGWSGRLADTALDGKRTDEVWGLDTAADAIARLDSLFE